MAKAAKTTKQTKTAPAKAEPVVIENRYLRAARILIELGDASADADLTELAVKANMSEATAGHCLSAFLGVCAALRDAKLLPPKATPKKAPTAPTTNAERAAEPELAVA